ncbi:MAG: hypothetical protein CMJ52_10610 [Planctomycetaceae bacterium]|nr:hypothetical protein [Planctomycetaceae bacterium]
MTPPNHDPADMADSAGMLLFLLVVVVVMLLIPLLAALRIRGRGKPGRSGRPRARSPLDPWREGGRRQGPLEDDSEPDSHDAMEDGP